MHQLHPLMVIGNSGVKWRFETPPKQCFESPITVIQITNVMVIETTTNSVT